MVLPSDDDALLRIRPLGGSEEETTAVLLDLNMPGEEVSSASFPQPKPDEIGSYETAKLLFDASRLSFRNSAGPFRCMGKLSFSPRAYQLVPLVMALKQDTVRLMIADDVGIGKTIEALLILREFQERGEVRSFAVICPPHLCEQWQSELKAKLDIDAEIIRSSTAAKLDRMIPDDRSVFHHIRHQVISIDYIKTDKRRGIFINDCPDFVIFDEAHTCARPDGSTSKSQMLRYQIAADVAANPKRHLVLLSATPHSGKDSEFNSLLGLLNPDFNALNFEVMTDADKKRVARHFVQRKRENIRKWLDEATSFPERDSKEIMYGLSDKHQLFYQELLKFARGISEVESDNKQAQLLRSWAAIALIKGAMSSPDMAEGVLARRSEKITVDAAESPQISIEDTYFDEGDFSGDLARQDLLEQLELLNEERNQLNKLRAMAAEIKAENLDQKIKSAAKIIKQWVKDGFNPIVFCHYIDTAHYVEAKLKEALGGSVHVEAITSELPDEARRERIDDLGKKDKRVLVATDCLSEGINLQAYFTAVLHYDLPWNPNRIEQREGRVDRFGQTAKEIKTYILYGEDNAMDNFIMEVLIRKVRDIQKSTGVSISIGDNSKSIMTEAAQKILYGKPGTGKQQQLFKEETSETIKNELELAKKKGERIKSIFAHESIDPRGIQNDLAEVDEAIGNTGTVASFVQVAVRQLGGNCKQEGAGYLLEPQNLPPHIRRLFGNERTVKICFESQVPRGYTYIGRNHEFVELLCQFIFSLAFDGHPEYGRIARVSEIQTDRVSTKTTLVMFRVRNVIKEVSSTRETVAEEMYLWGYRNSTAGMEEIHYEEAKQLLLEAEALTNLSVERQRQDLQREMETFADLQPRFMQLANVRAEKLVEAHSRFKSLIGGRRFEKATPVLPPDVMGVYMLNPKPTQLS
jgi:superfamily II DNA or RNA helicase